MAGYFERSTNYSDLKKERGKLRDWSGTRVSLITTCREKALTGFDTVLGSPEMKHLSLPKAWSPIPTEVVSCAYWNIDRCFEALILKLARCWACWRRSVLSAGRSGLVISETKRKEIHISQAVGSKLWLAKYHSSNLRYWSLPRYKVTSDKIVKNFWALKVVNSWTWRRTAIV